MVKLYILLFLLLISLTSQKKEFIFKETDAKARNLASVDLESLRKQLLISHNNYRKNHQVGNLERNSEIEKIAQQYAEYLGSIRQMVHSQNEYKGNSLGENLFWASGSITGDYVTNSWYNEIKNYDFNNQGFKQGTGHFTQVVWKSSNQLGCGHSSGYVVCNYYPAGNYLGQFERNVFPYKKAEGADSGSDSGSGTDSNKKDSASFKEESSMSTAGKVFLTIFVFLILAIIGFAVFHFVFQKKNFSQLKDYLCCK
jgi:uncharacterized protein YkwD